MPETPGASPDTARWSFTESGPWVLDPEQITWSKGLDELRGATKRAGERLGRPPGLPPAGRMARTGAELGQAIAAWRILDKPKGGSVSRKGISRRLRKAFERLGPTYIKLGQIVSAGEGIFPEELVAEFRLCRDEVPAESFEDVQRVIEQDLKCHLGEVFSYFEPHPIAAASIAQVHVARLVSGEDVVVKVQRPNVAKLVKQDLRAMAWIAPKLVGRISVAALANPPAIVELFANTIVEELDFRLEAENMLDIGRVLAETGQRSIVVPRPHPELVTRRVLVMERLHGYSFDDVESIRRAGVDTKAVIRAGMITTLEGAMLYGVFHGDLHPGNLFVDASGRVSLMDFGITGRLDEQRRLAFIRMLMGGVTNDMRTQLDALRDLGALPADTPIEDLIKDLGLDRPPKDPTMMSAHELVTEIREIVQKLVGYGARIPKELMLFIKNLLFLDAAIATLAPDLDLIGETFQVATYFAQRHGERLAAEAGTQPKDIDLEGFKASFGLDASVEHLTYRDLRERRRTISRKMEEHRRTQGRGLGLFRRRRRQT